ncbi:hypothetical protein [Rhodococcus sp. JVH1]|uniref:hypothetical protein n=1 Tax=Rhodococcus sp. JVH1 TaxID=745408 RepID=UPI000271E52A|nr:hypothetical protein [Rhodococcus sp. JVH1]EJI98589.1 hypothetical protein JVH1_3845 [Rhodococcus sp. JVH1]
MATPSETAAIRSRRLHTVKNVEENVKAARQRALERQNRIEELSKPLNSVSEKLARLDRERDSVSAAGDRRIESLKNGLQKKIEKLKADTAAQIEQAKKDSETKLAELHTSQRKSEDALMLEYAQAIVQFSHSGSNADLATVLGISQKKAKELIASSTAELEKAGISTDRPTDTASQANTPAPSAEQPAPATEDEGETEAAPVDAPALASA